MKDSVHVLQCQRMIYQRADDLKSAVKSCVWFYDQGRRYKSSKEVQVALRERRLLETDEGGSATDTDASEYAPSSVKQPKR